MENEANRCNLGYSKGSKRCWKGTSAGALRKYTHNATSGPTQYGHGWAFPNSHVPKAYPKLVAFLI